MNKKKNKKSELRFTIFFIMVTLLITLGIIALLFVNVLILKSIGIILTYSLLAFVWVVDDMERDSPRGIFAIVGGLVLLIFLIIYNLDRYGFINYKLIDII